MEGDATNVLAQKIASLLHEHISEIQTIQETTERLVSNIPFVQKLIQENESMRHKIQDMEIQGAENISLEISDTKVVTMDPDNTADLRTQQLLFQQFNENDSLSMRVRCGTVSPPLSYGSGMETASYEEEFDTHPEPEEGNEEAGEPEEEEAGEPEEEEADDEAEEEESDDEEEEADDEEEEEEEADDEEEEAEEVEEVNIGGVVYYTSDVTNGAIYRADDYGEPAGHCGDFVDGKPRFSET